ncbi:MAG TPA: flagellar biosynthesis anti-sigma factor FlgM [Phycisphaerae bacterium]|nr:flagellar biosynthesis anti-sigma factor FlgM [Phycisphaerae bacterium]
MADVFGLHPTSAADGISPADRLRPRARAAKASGVGDTVEISEAGKLAAKIHDIPLVRMDIVERVKAQIAAGTYETPKRIETTVDRLVEDFFSEYW